MAVRFGFMSKSEQENLNKIELSNFESYDRSLVIFLTSTFGFSLLAVSYIVQTWGSLCHGWLLLVGWILLTSAIVLFLFNFYIAYRDVQGRRKDSIEKSPYNDKTRKLIININWAVGLMYVISICLIATFAALNIWTLVSV